VTLALFAYWWATLGSGGPGRGTGRARWVGWSAGITAAVALLMLVVPLVIERLYHSTGALGTVVQFFGFGGPGDWCAAAPAGVRGVGTVRPGTAGQAEAAGRPVRLLAGADRDGGRLGPHEADAVAGQPGHHRHRRLPHPAVGRHCGPDRVLGRPALARPDRGR